MLARYGVKLVVAVVIVIWSMGEVVVPLALKAQTQSSFVPVTDATLENPEPGDWLMWRRTLDGWGYSPLDQINRDNVGDLRLVWSRALHTPGRVFG